ncbi:MAG: endolytic transglycosylase MltG [Candidatus Harrisonbacteria bacterium]|nr:endolytic transglycosylase MltG [Candidatus Harrisonbacteria bacterium]
MQRLLFIFWTSISLVIALFLFFLGSAAANSDYRSVEILPGTGFKEIAGLLENQKIIRSRNTFLIYGILSGSAHQLKPGNYLLSAGSSTPAIVLSLTRGPEIDREITFPEGVTLKDIDTMLAREKILPAGALINLNKSRDKGLEGFLFPDTYRFFINSNTEQAVRKFLDNFEKKAVPLLGKCLVSSGKCQELLTIASLLEKEAPEFRDRQIIAGIIYKRLEAGIALHIDATITYAKCGGAFLTCDDPKVYRKDLDFQSRYNTYLYNGLPPGPIGNPGLEAIKAALNPIKSEYLYYLSDPKTKKTIFSQTLEEHIENRAKYLGV